VMQCLLCWAVFFKRNKIVAFFAIDPGAHQQSGSGSMAAMRVLGAAYAAHRLGGVAVGAAKRPLQAHRVNSLERSMAREQATRDLAYGELESQELDAAQRGYDHHKQTAESAQTKIDWARGELEQLKQNPDYRKYTAWQRSKEAHEKAFGGEEHERERPPIPSPEEQERGRQISQQISRLEGQQSDAKATHAASQAIVNHGDRKLQAHGQLLSPAEIGNRIEARRDGLEQRKSTTPNAWKRPENLELARKHTTPERVSELEQQAQQPTKKGRQAQAELQSLKNEVTTRMGVSERLLTGVPTRNQFDRNHSASDPKQAASTLEGEGKKYALDSRAETRLEELRTQRRARTILYRARA
ncbi:MAG: hypothetical protein ACRDK2_10210, partial [Solirubrobacteraceae bacterium]